MVVEELSNLRETALQFPSSIILQLVSFLTEIRDVTGPDVFADVAELVHPVSDPDGLVIVNNLLPVTLRSFNVFRQVQNNVLRMDSWLPSSPHRMAASPHEEAGQVHHPVGNLSLHSINLCKPVLLLKR